MHRWPAALAAVTVFGGIAALNAAGSRAEAEDMVLIASRAPAKGHRHYSFELSGSPGKPLYPGAVQRIDLTFSNPFGRPVRVTAVSAKLTSTSKPGCAPASTNLEVRSYHGSLPVTVHPQSRKKAGYIEVHMPNSVADACQKVSFTIRFTGAATEAGR